MNAIVLANNFVKYGLSTFKNTTPNFFKAAGIITIIETILFYTRRYDAKVNPLLKNRVSDIRRSFHFIYSSLVIIYFSIDRDKSLFTFLKNHPAFIAIKIANIPLYIEPFRSFLKNKINSLQTPEVMKKTDEYVNYFVQPILKMVSAKTEETTSKEFYNTAIVPPIAEELIFRGIIQKIFLREVPKFVLFSLGAATQAHWIDSSLFKILRIGISAYLFGSAHLHVKKGLFETMVTTVGGLEESYHSENLGISGAILSHFANNIYTFFANAPKIEVNSPIYFDSMGNEIFPPKLTQKNYFF